MENQLNIRNYIVTQIKLFAIHHQKMEHDLERKSHSCNGFFQKCFPTFQTEKLSHADLDERALDALKEFPVEVFQEIQEGNVENPATLPSCLYWLASLTLPSYFISFHLFIIFTTSWLKTCISGSPGCPQAVFGIKFGENFSHFRAFNVFTSCLCDCAI